MDSYNITSHNRNIDKLQFAFHGITACNVYSATVMMKIMSILFKWTVRKLHNVLFTFATSFSHIGILVYIMRLTLAVLVATIDAQGEGMGDVG